MDNNVKKLDNSTKGTDAAFQDVLSVVHNAIWVAKVVNHLVAKLPDSFLKQDEVEQVKMNAAEKSASDFVDKLREALNGNDHKLWAPVVTHGTSYEGYVY